MEGHKLHNSMDTLDYVGDSQVSHSAESEQQHMLQQFIVY